MKFLKMTKDTYWAVFNFGATNIYERGYYLSYDDAMKIFNGCKFRLPNSNDYKILKKQCRWEWTSNGSLCGYNVYSSVNESKYIFIPACGFIDKENQKAIKDINKYGVYWSSTNIGDNNVGLFFDKSTRIQYNDDKNKFLMPIRLIMNI